MRSHIFASVLFLLALSSFSNAAHCQSANEQNPIIYGEFFGGHSFGKAGGLSGGMELNYQANKSLFTFGT